MTILDEILANTAVELEAAKVQHAPDALAAEAEACPRAPLGFRAALRATPGASVIAEVKRRSPSKGLIRADFDPAWIAQCYAEAGAACISVLTDEKFFGGSLAFLEAVRAAVDRPLLRKDFMIDPYQVDEARIRGADAILLIVSALDDETLARLDARARSLGLDVLVEVHDEAELDRARALGADLIGVNNRNLKTFETDLATTERLATKLDDPDIVLVAESGIGSGEDIARLERAGAAGFLVGESLMRQPHPGQALEALLRRGSGQGGASS
ncbi:MAG: indole-3-glycerol phosphate synthase TrpC [Myxococcota bacterium]